MKWYSKYLSAYDKDPESLDKGLIEAIKRKMDKLQSDKPLVTLGIIAHNEEKHIVPCLWSISEMVTEYPLEIIVVDNASSDRTAELAESCGAICLKESRKGPGFARQCALDAAKGEYCLTMDSDMLYPKEYVQRMVNKLIHKKAIAVNGKYSYIVDKDHSALGMWFYELVRDTYSWLQHFKRPELCIRGAVFGYVTAPAKEVGIRTDIKRGEDGSLALALKKSGKIVFVNCRRARAATGYQSSNKEGGMIQLFFKQCNKYIKRLGSLFTTQEHYEDMDDNMIR